MSKNKKNKNNQFKENKGKIKSILAVALISVGLVLAVILITDNLSMPNSEDEIALADDKDIKEDKNSDDNILDYEEDGEKNSLEEDEEITEDSEDDNLEDLEEDNLDDQENMEEDQENLDSDQEEINNDQENSDNEEDQLVYVKTQEYKPAQKAVYEDVWVVDVAGKDAQYETVVIPEEGHYQDVKVKDAWTETIYPPAEKFYWLSGSDGSYFVFNFNKYGGESGALAAKNSKEKELSNKGFTTSSGVDSYLPEPYTVDHDPVYEERWIVDKEEERKEVRISDTIPEEGHWEKVKIKDAVPAQEEKWEWVKP